MNTYEMLQNKAYKNGIEVIDYLFNSPNIKGLYCNNTIAINKNLHTQIEKSCILAEELGHHFTSSGNILDQTDIVNRKQEYRARLYGYNLSIGLIGIAKAFESGCQNLYEMADFLDVTEEYLKEAIESYRKKYGIFTVVDNYLIYFEPQLSVAKINSL